MGKLMKKEMCEADLDFEILMAQKRLDELKLKKLDFANRIVRKTQFDNLPESIENIAAHIAIREGARIYIIDAHDSYELFTVHQLASTNISFKSQFILCVTKDVIVTKLHIRQFREIDSKK